MSSGLAGVLTLERNAPQSLSAQGSDERGSLGDRNAGRRTVGDRPGHLRGDVLRIIGLALVDVPAVVAALLDEVQLVSLVGSELGRPEATGVVEGDSLY